MLQERIPKVVYQIQIKAQHLKEIELAKAILIASGCPATDLIETSSGHQPAVEFFSEEKMVIDRLKKLFVKLKLSAFKVVTSRLKPEDWLLRWKIGWKPAVLTQLLDVVPAWYKEQYKPRRGCDYILMDTLLSFGTGLHETTQIMAQFIEGYRGKIGSFLDIGTGTGILALTAMKHGATKVFAIDIGELSVQAAQDNMKINDLYFKVKKADIKKFKHKEQYDFVAANLVTQDLIDSSEYILPLVKKGGLLAVSGISLDNLPKLRKAFRILPLTSLKIVKAKEWSGVLYRKNV